MLLHGQYFCGCFECACSEHLAGLHRVTHYLCIRCQRDCPQRDSCLLTTAAPAQPSLLLRSFPHPRRVKCSLPGRTWSDGPWTPPAQTRQAPQPLSWIILSPLTSLSASASFILSPFLRPQVEEPFCEASQAAPLWSALASGSLSHAENKNSCRGLQELEPQTSWGLISWLPALLPLCSASGLLAIPDAASCRHPQVGLTVPQPPGTQHSLPAPPRPAPPRHMWCPCGGACPPPSSTVQRRFTGAGPSLKSPPHPERQNRTGPSSQQTSNSAFQ